MTTKPTTRDLLLARKKELEAEVASIKAASGPVRKFRDELQAKLQPMEAKLREMNGEIKRIEQPALSNAEMELAALARALGSKSMQAAAADAKVEG